MIKRKSAIFLNVAENIGKESIPVNEDQPSIVTNEQILEFFNHYCNIYLSAFRPGYGTRSTFLKIIEDWEKALDENKFVAAILMDLSKAFDFLPRDLLLLKMKAYVFSENALKLIKLSIYYSFILSNFNYCPLTWRFCGETNTHTKKKKKKLRKYKKELYASYIMTIHQIMNRFSQILKCQL